MSVKVRNSIIVIFWVLFVIGVGVIAYLFKAISDGSIGYMPPVEELENPINKYASLVISGDGKLLGSYAHSKDNRVYTKYKDLSPDLVKALIATEDIRFSEHSGIDIQGLFRAIIKRGVLMQKNAGGGSTITQQLAKQLFTPKADNLIERFFQKPIEWVIAVRLERYYTKEEIINMYLNKFDFLYNAVGVRSASQVYFDKVPKDLKTEESATLIGMCKNPSYFNPLRYNERTRGRRNTVLYQMLKAGYLTKVQCDSLCNLPLTLHFSRMDHKDGLAPYFREYLRQILMVHKPDRNRYASWQGQKFHEDSVAWETNPLYGWCNKNKKSNGENYNIYTDGLKIFTTLNAKMQQYAEESMTAHLSKDLQPKFTREKKGRSYAPFSKDLSSEEIESVVRRSMHQTERYRSLKKNKSSQAKIDKAFNTPVDMRVFSWNGQIDTVMTPRDSILYYKGFLRSAFMAMDPRTGQVKAYVGGMDFNNFQYDMINGGRRQVGSTIKPFLYSLAMMEGVSPCDKLIHEPQHLVDENGKEWSPRNAGAKKVGEEITVKWGLQHSSNWVTAYLMKQLSPYTFVNLLHSFGLKNHIDPVISVCLGTPDVSVGEMVSGYTAFPNRGIRVDPLYVTHIEDAYGNTIARFTPQMKEVLTEEASFKMLYMLRSVIDGGTGIRCRYKYKLKAEMGGKTGTTQNNSDGWFMGFTPSLVAGCWVGGEDRSIHFDRIQDGQGASMALPIYGLFMQKVYADKSLGYSEDEKFEVPERFEDPCKTISTKKAAEDKGVKVEKLGNGIDRMFE